ncbi:MAG: 50S ribosomal protein L2 [Candidatus Kaiserbacteria bacterium]|nr:50S ribosomal protein L2 [Candidatus Kaiserbacteria bacterium]
MKTYKPTTDSRRHMTTLPYKELLSGDEPHKPLLSAKKRRGGRNSFGRITMRHQGGGHKRRLRDVDFKFDKKNIPAVIETVEYDPFRSAFIGLALYNDGERRYVVLPKEVKVGSSFVVSEDAPLTVGNRLPLGKIPVGTSIYNVEIAPGTGASLVRSAGTFAEVVVSDLAWASIGAVGNEEYNLVVIGKAGRSRWLGIRPTVRGTAMNPVDHPHGGGEGRQGRGLRRAKTKWGKPSGKGQKTRTPKKYSNVFIVARRKVGKKRKAYRRKVGKKRKA